MYIRDENKIQPWRKCSLNRKCTEGEDGIITFLFSDVRSLCMFVFAFACVCMCLPVCVQECMHVQYVPVHMYDSTSVGAGEAVGVFAHPCLSAWVSECVSEDAALIVCFVPYLVVIFWYYHGFSRQNWFFMIVLLRTFCLVLGCGYMWINLLRK